MKLEDFKKLEESILEQDFSRSFKNINKVIFFLSIFGHISSIFLAYFLVSKILSGAISNNPILVGICTIILLGGLELLKREIFDKLSLQQIKFKSFISKDVLPLTISSLLIVSISFYASISGAKEFSSKSNQIDNQVTTTIRKYEDSVIKYYNDKNIIINNEIKSKNDKIDLKDNEQTIIESNSKITTQQRNRIKDLKSEKSELKNEILQLNSNISSNRDELQRVVKEYEDKITKEGNGKKQENKTNSFLFVIISIIIEFIILIGVYFNEYYKYRSYTDFKSKIEKDPNYQKWYNYNAILDVIYNSDTKINDRLPSGKLISDICKVNGIILLNRDIIDLFKLFNSLGITRNAGSVKYISKTKDSAQEILKNHFNIK